MATIRPNAVLYSATEMPWASWAGLPAAPPVGAWAPKAEQMACAKYLASNDQYNSFLKSFKKEIHSRLIGFHAMFTKLKSEGFNVDAISPQAAIYLTVKIDLLGKTTASGETLDTTAKGTRYILDEAKIALVPFYAFGSSVDSTWYRLSVGTSKMSDIDEVYSALKNALLKLS